MPAHLDLAKLPRNWEKQSFSAMRWRNTGGSDLEAAGLYPLICAAA